MPSLTRIPTRDHAVRRLSGPVCWIVAAIFVFAFAAPAAAISILKSFPGDPTDGATPYTAPVLDGAGYLYGTASCGGATDNGVVFKVKTDGSGYTVLHSFMGGDTDGLFPYAASLALVGDRLYGTTWYGGPANKGTVFAIKTDGSGFAVMHAFAGDGSEGYTPYGGLVFDGASTLYGTTYLGGAASRGTIFTIRTDGTSFTVLHAFDARCRGPITLDGAGNLYGNTMYGGTSDAGTVFTMKTDGSNFTVLHNFVSASEGANPWFSVILDGAGAIFGTTGSGGASNFGTVFSLKTDGSNFTVLHTFAGGASDGAAPHAGLTLVGDALYGVTTIGGASGQGTLFSLKTDGTGFAILHNFSGGGSNGVVPRAAPTFDGVDTLYGPTMYGGRLDLGTIYKIKTNGNDFAIVHAFAWAPPDGAYPFASLIPDNLGNLYGTAANGGASGMGTLFRLKKDGTDFTVLHSFTGSTSDGASPSAALILDGAGNIYGTTPSGGQSSMGIIFTLKTDGTSFTLLHSFAGGTTDGAAPNGPLVLDGSGTLYGTSSGGGASNKGTIFSLTTGGSDFAVLHHFAGETTDGANPQASLILDGGGNLYGTTYLGGALDFGTIFSLKIGGSDFAILHSFTGGAYNGAYPNTSLILDGAGNLYGTTGGGGMSDLGTVFRLKKDGTFFTVLHNFSWDASDGYWSESLVGDGAGSLYSTTCFGGASGKGTVFTLKTDGTGFSLLHSFASIALSSRSIDYSSLILDAGTLYGTTVFGGASNIGAVFSLPVTGDMAPAITSATAATFGIGSFNSFVVTTTGYPAPSITLVGALPTGVTFTDNGDGTATLAGTPAAGTAGAYPLTITAHNGIGSDASQSFMCTVATRAVAPTFSPAGGTFTTAQTVTLSTITAGASINYTTDGSKPSATVGTLYTTPITVSVTTTIKAVAFASVLNDSTVSTATYRIRAVAPTFSPAGGTYTTSQAVTLSTTTSGASIKYTTDGSTPSDMVGTLYTEPITVSATTTIKAVAYASGLVNSTVSTATYRIRAVAPTFSPAGGTYTTPQTVTLSTTTTGASINYTTDGSTPSDTVGTPYTEPFTVSVNTTIKAVAYASGLVNSTVSTATYRIRAVAPTFSPAGGTYTTSQAVTLSTTTSGASINYTTDGSTPSDTVGTPYTGPFTVSVNTTVRAVAYASGLVNSTVSTATYRIR